MREDGPADATEATDDDPSDAQPKRPRNDAQPKRSRKTTAQSISVEHASSAILSLATPVPGRQKVWLECVADAIDASGAGYNVVEHFGNIASHDVAAKCAVFIHSGQYQKTSGGKPTAKWSVARPAICLEGTQDRRKLLPATSDELVSALSAASIEPDVLSERCWQSVLSTFLDQPEQIANLHELLEINDPSMPPAMVPLYGESLKVNCCLIC